MSVTAVDFFEFAKRIAETARHEIDHRNAVSRIYYAAYHASLTRFVKKGGFTPDRGHSEFCAQLMSEPVGSPNRSLGIALNFLRQHRNAADYALDRDFEATDSKTAFGAYGNVIRLLEEASPEETSDRSGQGDSLPE